MIEWLKRYWHKDALACSDDDIVKAQNKLHEAEIGLWNAKNRKDWHERKLPTGD